VLPQIARGDSNKLWIVPSELGEALKGIGGMLGNLAPQPPAGDAPTRAAAPQEHDVALDEPTLQDPQEALAAARREAADASAAAEGAATAGISPGAMPSRSASRPGQLGPIDPAPAPPGGRNDAPAEAPAAGATPAPAPTSDGDDTRR
jgi:hypothetical protein